MLSISELILLPYLVGLVTSGKQSIYENNPVY